MCVSLDTITWREALYIVLIRWGAIGWANRCMSLLLRGLSYDHGTIYLDILNWLIILLMVLAFVQLRHAVAVIWQKLTLKSWTLTPDLRCSWYSLVLLCKHRIHLHLSIRTCRYHLMTWILNEILATVLVLVEWVGHLNHNATLTGGRHLSWHIVSTIILRLFQICCRAEYLARNTVRLGGVWILTR